MRGGEGKERKGGRGEEISSSIRELIYLSQLDKYEETGEIK